VIVVHGPCIGQQQQQGIPSLMYVEENLLFSATLSQI
jgi:hypothetical protein